MPGDARIGNTREVSFLRERVAMAQSARLHFHSDLSRPGLRDLSLDHLKRSTGPAHLYCTHVGPTPSPKTWGSGPLQDLVDERRASVPRSQGKESGKPRTVKPRDIAA